MLVNTGLGKAHLISESELRAAVHNALVAQTMESESRIFEELCIERGAARIDFAVIGPSIHGIEVKSDYDGYSRMHNQIHSYNRVFDRITLVTGMKLLDSALQLMPRWWGITVATRNTASEIVLTEVRPPLENPDQDAFSLATLLWSQEAKAMLVAEQMPSKKGATRTELCGLIASKV